MQIKLKTLYATAEGIRQIGEVIEVGPSEGKQLVGGGFDIALSEPKVEKAVRRPAETAKRKYKKKSKK